MSKASREVANLTERKNPHTPVYGFKEFIKFYVGPCVSPQDQNILPQVSPIVSGLVRLDIVCLFTTMKLHPDWPIFGLF